MRTPGLPMAADAAGYRGDVLGRRWFNTMTDATFGAELIILYDVGSFEWMST